MNAHCVQWDLDPKKLPRHVGLIMDGNGRWAQKRSLPRLIGHKKGAEKANEIIELAGQLGIEAITLYAFSSENWNRPLDEVQGVMKLLHTYIVEKQARMMQNNVRFQVIGDRSRLQDTTVRLISELEAKSKHHDGLRLNIAISYGAQDEIVRTVQRLAHKVAAGQLPIHDITCAVFEQHLDTADLHPVDLLIRTSGEQRISNFLLWQIAYAELYFSPILWPDFDRLAFVRILKEFASRDRRFGALPQNIQLTQRQLGRSC